MTVVELDAEQTVAVTIDPGVRQVVIAGPGAGKTQVVAELLRHLVDEEDVEPTDEMLVISFSRAAVAAVHGRSRTDGGRSRLVTVRTLDSLASSIIAAADDGDAWRGSSFDDRIVRATALVADGEWEESQDLRHVIVDEVQDVVGVRADFLARLLGRLPASTGFTLLGDPQQAIYDFQLKDQPGATTSDRFLDDVLASGAVRIDLRGQYRARSDETRQAAGLGREIAETPAASRTLVTDEFVDRLPDIGSAGELASLLPRWEGRTALLCRDNGDVLSITRALREIGVDVAQQRSAREQSVDRWVADVLAERRTATMTRDELAEALAGRPIEPEAAWRWLRSLGGGRGRELDVLTVARRLALGVLPVELQSTSRTATVVSTIHRAKGLEFDNAVLVNPQTWVAEEGSDPSEVARTTFVAASRARFRLASLTSSRSWNLRLHKSRGVKRWYLGGREKYMRFGFEVVPSDLGRQLPPGRNPDAVQEHLRDRVHPGDPLRMEFDPRLSTLETPVYTLWHGGVEVGVTGSSFGDAFAACVKPRRTGRPWPEAGEVAVDAVVTIAGDPQPTGAGGAGRWGLWRGVDASGLVDLKWN